MAVSSLGGLLRLEDEMCTVCEHTLYEERRRAESGSFDPCPQCGKFVSNEGGACYHCFAVGNTIDECAECSGKPWSEEFLCAKAEIEHMVRRSVQ